MEGDGKGHPQQILICRLQCLTVWGYNAVVYSFEQVMIKNAKKKKPLT